MCVATMGTEKQTGGFFMLKEGINGFCMALADSVPGVSGRTVAFIMGFYDRFIGAVHDLVFGGWKERKTALFYLGKLGIGWAVGMALAAVALSALFERYIYEVSSLFVGFIVGAIPVVAEEEKDSMRGGWSGLVFFLTGLAVVAGITWANGHVQGGGMDLRELSAGTPMKLLFVGMLAISAMFLPGISGSTLLLVFGAYMPVITAVRDVLSLDFSCLPGLSFFGGGILLGAVTTVRVVKLCLDRFRPQTVYAILGMMIGSLYAIVMGPTTLETPAEPLGNENFSAVACILGLALVLGMHMLAGHGKEDRTKRGDAE